MNRAWSFALAGGLLLAACDGTAPTDPGADQHEPGLAWHACPDRIGLTVTTKHRCGTLTVPLDHDDPKAGTLDLAVFQAWSAEGATSTDEVAITLGFNFGEPKHDAGTMPGLSERVAVPVVALAPRGVGEEGGVPLDCPEVDGVGAGSLGEPDSASRGSFVGGVAACRDRLVSEGVDLDLFGIDDMAEDVEDLRSAMGVDRWFTMISYGELSRVTDVYAAAYGSRVRAVVEDSPAPHGRDSFAAAGEGLRSALDALFTECAEDPVCARRYPDLAARWQAALERVAAKPLTANATGGELLVDAPRFVRAVRAMLGNGPGLVPDVPRIITTAAEGQLHPTLASVVGTDDAYCLGYRPLCTKPEFSMGAYLSQACPELGTQNSPQDDPLYRQVFADSPYVDACDVWDVEASEPAPAPAVATLVLVGHLDSWSRPEWFDDAVVVRGHAHDVAGTADCVFDIRNPWIADPAQPPDPRPCEDEPSPAWD